MEGKLVIMVKKTDTLITEMKSQNLKVKKVSWRCQK